MKTSALLVVLALAAVISCDAESSPSARRDEALRRINACLRRNEALSRECKKLNQNIQTLIEVYRGGDKSVLPVLLKFTYLTEFYDEALLDDPDGFLAAVSQLPETAQKEVAIGIAGGHFRPVTRPRFTALRLVLTSKAQSSPVSGIAQECLNRLETNNALLFENYFPPQTFTGRVAELHTFWYSRDLYSLGELPLWPATSGVTTYRFTHLGSFTGPKTLILTIAPDGAGTIRIKSLNRSRERLEIDDSKPVNAWQVSQFLEALAQANYWQVPAELPRSGVDGADWILEGVQSGQYRMVVRWCPGTDSGDPQVQAFAHAARLLLEFSGHKQPGGC